MTPFGDMLRRERKAKGLLLGGLAGKLNISIPYLSQIENGHRAVPDGFVDKVVKALALPPATAVELEQAAAAARSQFIIQLGTAADADDRTLAAELANSFARLTPLAKKRLRAVIKGDRRD